MRALVTGAAGVIGSHLVDALLDRGWTVTGLDNLSIGKPQRLDAARRQHAFRLIEGDVLDTDLVDQLVAESDTVFHLAAIVGVHHVLASPLQALKINVRGTEHVLDACFCHGRRVVIASSSEIFGKSDQLPFREESDRLLGPTSIPRWGYATAKALDEHLLYAYVAEGLRGSIVRYSGNYGPRVDPRGYGSVIARFVDRALAGQPLTVHGDGSQTRSFTYVSDSVDGTIRAAEADAAIGLAFNLGTDEETSILGLAELVIRLTESASRIDYVPYETVFGRQFEDPPRRVFDPTRSREVLGYVPRVRLRDGLARLVEWARADRRRRLAAVEAARASGVGESEG